MNHLSDETNFTIAVTAAMGAPGTSDINGTVLEMSGYEGVLVITMFGAMGGGAQTAIKAQQGTAANLSDAEDLAGTRQVIPEGSEGSIYYLDIRQPLKPYVRVVIDRGVANVTCAAMYLQYNPRGRPVGQGANVFGMTWLAPIAGVA